MNELASAFAEHPRLPKMLRVQDSLPDIVKSAAGVRWGSGSMSPSVMAAGDVDSDTVASIDDLLREVSPDLRLKR